MRAAALVVWLGMVPAAHADSDDRTNTWLSLPILLGLELSGDGSDGVAIGTRPELIYAPGLEKNGKSRFGAGGYGEFVAGDGERVLGGGLTVVRYRGDVSFALSFGVHGTVAGSDEPNGGVVASLFFGARGKRWNIGCDAPYGIRIDARSTFDGDRVIAISAQLDVLGLVFGAVSGLVFKPPG